MRNVSARIDPAPSRDSGKARAALVLAALAALGFAGCAQQPPQLATTAHSKEYFPSAIYGAASRRVIENGPVPHGGGQYLVGRPYSVAGHTYYPSERKLVQVGNASWYGDAFHGRLTANGEIYDRNSFTAAHPTMPLPSYARVTNLRTQASMIVRVNDRGPFAANRVMDVSRGVAEALNFRQAGTAKVKVEYVGRASLAGSDDQKLYATLRQNGPAEWHEGDAAMVAEARPMPRVAAIEPRQAEQRPVEQKQIEARQIEERPVEPRPLVAKPPVIDPAVGAMPPRRRFAVPATEPLEDARPRHFAARTEPRPVERRVARDEEGRAGWHRGPEPINVLARPGAARSQLAYANTRSGRVVEPMPPARPTPRDHVASLLARAPLPPSRGYDPGPRGPRHQEGLRLARSRDD